MGMAAWRGSSRAASQSPPARESAPSPSSTASARGSTATPISTRPSPTASSCRDRTAPTGHRPSCPLGRSPSRGPAASSSSRRLSFSPRLADLIPQPRRHRHRYHGVFAPNHPLRPAVTALAERECREAARCRDGRACERRPRHGRMLRREPREPKAPLARHVADCLGQADGEGGGGVSARVPSVRRRHPAHLLTPKPGPIRKILTPLGQVNSPQAPAPLSARDRHSPLLTANTHQPDLPTNTFLKPTA